MWFFTLTHPFNGPLSGTTRVSQYQKGKTNLDFSEARDSEWQWHRLDHMQVCTSIQTDNHANTSLLSFLQAGCPSCRPTNSVKALKASYLVNAGLSGKPAFKNSLSLHVSIDMIKYSLIISLHLLWPSPSTHYAWHFCYLDNKHQSNYSYHSLLNENTLSNNL